MKKLILISLLIASQINGLLAQQPPASDQPVLPPGPWPFRTVTRAAWTIHIEPTNSSPNKAGESNDNSSPDGATPTKTETVIKVTKTLPVVHEVATTPDGKTMDKWYKNGVEITLASGSSLFMICNVPTPIFFHDYSRSDFDDFDWLSKGTFTGTETVNGTSCFCFSAKMLFSAGHPPKIVSGDATSTNISEAVLDVKADLDVKTLLPVQLIWGLEKRTYEFAAAPGEQTLPAEFQTALDDQIRKQKAMTIAPPRSY